MLISLSVSNSLRGGDLGVLKHQAGPEDEMLSSVTVTFQASANPLRSALSSEHLSLVPKEFKHSQKHYVLGCNLQ